MVRNIDPTKKAAFNYPVSSERGVTLRDFSKGRICKASLNQYLIASNYPNSVADSMNVNFDTTVGSAVVRLGTSIIGSAVASNKTPLGLTNFVGTGGTPNLIVAAFKGASTASIYYYDTSWHTSGLTALSNTAKVRFAQIGGRVFKVNGEQMLSSADGNLWNSTNSISFFGTSSGSINIQFIKPTLILRTKQRLLVAGDSQFRDRVFFSSVISPYTNVNQVSVSSITRSLTIASVTTSTPHGLVVGDYVTISGANEPEYNGSFMVFTVGSTTTFSYGVLNSPSTPATGTIVAYPAQISYDTDKVTGDYIDINPDDGQNLTALAETSNQVIAFKPYAMYRLDVVNKTVDSQNIFNVGAVSQEGVVSCQGLVYFYSGLDIRVTDGTYPQQISRFGVQDYIDAIPVANRADVCAGTDGLNVYFSIGNITLNTNKNTQVAYTNVVLKFSPRDQAWSIHSYGQPHQFYSTYTDSTDGFKMISADTTGSVQKINKGNTDNTVPIYFSLETQEQEFTNRALTKNYNDVIAVFASDAIESSIQVKSDDGTFQDLKESLPLKVNIIDDMKFTGHYVTFKWFGSTSTSQPKLEGIFVPDINIEGMQATQV